MPTTEEKIAELEERLSKTKKNKATMKSIVTIKAEIAKLRRQLVKDLSSKGGGGQGFGVRKTGDAQIALIGFPSVGKSTLLNYLTGGSTDSKVAAYEFTTLNCVPGMMILDKIAVQILDLPGIIIGASQGRGRGREILSVLRSVDLILIIIDYNNDGTVDVDRLDAIRQELHNIGIRLNKIPPNIKIKRTHKGGVMVTHSVKLTHLDDKDLVKAICNNNKLTNCHVTLYEDATPEDLIDAILGNCVYIPAIIAVNKADLVPKKERKTLPQIVGEPDVIPISGKTGLNIDKLKQRIYERLQLIKIFLKPKKKEADMEKPLVMKAGSTIEDITRKIHNKFYKSFRYAKVWGESAKHPGQIVHLNHVVADNDLITIFLK